MKKQTIHSWCIDATRLIKFPPDRVAVQEELHQHLLDKQEYLRSQGVPEEEIESKAIEAMGSAEEIAPQLASIHKPFWGYAYRVCCGLLILLVLVSIPSLFSGIHTLWNKHPWKEPALVYLNAENGDQALFHSYPNTKVLIGDYTITVSEVIVFQTRLHDLGQYNELCTDCRIMIKVQHPKMYTGQDIFQYIWAEDSLGNVYHSSATGGYLTLCDDIHIRHTYPQLYGFTYYYEISFHDLLHLDFLSKDAQWIDLHYDRDGTKFTIPIDLKGGNS